MRPATTGVSVRPEPELLGQTVVVIGGSAGIGLETARRARGEGAEVVLTGRDPERLERAALEVDARSTAAFDANDPASLEGFFNGLPDPMTMSWSRPEARTTGPCSRWTQLRCARR
jgi:hypothetical protein